MLYHWNLHHRTYTAVAVFDKRILNGIYNILVRVMGVSRITDSQCGFKCFSGEQVFALFDKQTISGFAFDVEILFLAQRAGITIREIDIDWYYMPNSKVRPILDAICMTWDLARIRWIHKFCLLYTSDAADE